MDGAGRSVAVVIPCYRSAGGIGALLSRIAATLDGLGEARDGTWLAICVDDASPDDGATWRALLDAKARHGERLKVLRLARNVGQHDAILCGLSAVPPGIARVVTMDDDGQHAPEDIPALLDALDAGADLAIGAYDEKRHAAGRNLGGALVDGVLRRLFGLPRDFALTSFRAMRRFVAEDALASQGGYGYLTASLLGATSRRTNVPVRHEPRRDGRSGYTLARSLSLASNLLLTYSRLPLLATAAVGAISFLLALLSLGYVLWLRVVREDIVPGWASLMLMIGVQSTMLMAAMVTILLYVARSHRLLAGLRLPWRVADER